MSYRIEFLKETTDADSVCHAHIAHGSDLESVEREAFAEEDFAKTKGATGFQIRHLNAVDEVIAIANFADAALADERSQ